MRAVKSLLSVVVIMVVFAALMMGVSYLISPPGNGEILAANLNIPYPLVAAHRGLSYDAPESTVEAYIQARDSGAHFLEADLQRTGDGVIVAFHDDNLSRTTNVEDVFPGREREPLYMFTYEELQQLDAGSWFNEAYPERAGEEYTGLKIITLDELIDIAEEGHVTPGLYLETKNAQHYPNIEEDIVKILHSRGWINQEGIIDNAQVIFQSFHYESLQLLKELAPDVTRVLLINQEMVKRQGFNELLDIAVDTAHGIGPVGYISWPWNIRKAHKLGLIVHVFTINAPWQMHLIRYFGADGIFTDRSNIALDIYDIYNPATPESSDQRQDND